MSIQHTLLALLTIVAWGFNFMAVKIGLEQLPPLLFTALRFFFIAFPWVFFVKRPPAFSRALFIYAMGTFVLQFAFLFSAMAIGASAGLASLILQIQVFFTIFFAYIAMREKPHRLQLMGLFVSTIGLLIILFNLNGEMPVIAFCLLIAAAAAWGSGNIASKYLNTMSIMTLVVWGGVLAFPPLMVASFLLENSYWQWQTISTLSTQSILSLAYVVYFATFLGYGMWGYLLQRNPAGEVAQFSLLVPIIGFSSSAIFLNETLYTWKIVAGALIMAGLLVSRMRLKKRVKK